MSWQAKVTKECRWQVKWPWLVVYCKPNSQGSFPRALLREAQTSKIVHRIAIKCKTSGTIKTNLLVYGSSSSGYQSSMPATRWRVCLFSNFQCHFLPQFIIRLIFTHRKRYSNIVFTAERYAGMLRAEKMVRYFAVMGVRSCTTFCTKVVSVIIIRLSPILAFALNMIMPSMSFHTLMTQLFLTVCWTSINQITR